MSCLQDISWHYCLRVPCDVTLHGPRRYPIELMYLWPSKGEAVFYHNVGLWLNGECHCNIVLANLKGVKEPWAVITDEEPSLQTLWQYGLRFRVEELFLDSKKVVLCSLLLLCFPQTLNLVLPPRKLKNNTMMPSGSVEFEN